MLETVLKTKHSVQVCAIKHVNCPLNLPVSWACWESILKSCDLMRIETLNNLFRTSSAKRWWLLTYYEYLVHVSLHPVLPEDCRPVYSMMLPNSLHSTWKFVPTGEGCTTPLDSLIMDHFPTWFSDFPQEWSLQTKPYPLEHSRTLLTGGEVAATVMQYTCAPW